METNRTQARWIGLFFIAPLFAYGFGNHFITNENPILGGALMLANSMLVAVLGVWLSALVWAKYPRVALGYLVARCAEAIFLALGVVALLLVSDAAAWAALLQKTNFWLYQLGMLSLALGSVGLFAVLKIKKALPVWLAWWGIAGYIGLGIGAVCECGGLAWGIWCALPGGFFELFLGIWLIFNGFTPNQNPVS